MVEEKTREHSGGVHLALRFVVVLWWFFLAGQLGQEKNPTVEGGK